MMENKDIITKHIQKYLFYQNVDLKKKSRWKKDVIIFLKI